MPDLVLWQHDDRCPGQKVPWDHRDVACHASPSKLVIVYQGLMIPSFDCTYVRLACGHAGMGECDLLTARAVNEQHLLGLLCTPSSSIGTVIMHAHDAPQLRQIRTPKHAGRLTLIVCRNAHLLSVSARR